MCCVMMKMSVVDSIGCCCVRVLHKRCIAHSSMCYVMFPVAVLSNQRIIALVQCQFCFLCSLLSSFHFVHTVCINATVIMCAYVVKSPANDYSIAFFLLNATNGVEMVY